MKSVLYTVCLVAGCLVLQSWLPSQRVQQPVTGSGIYRSAADYQQGKLSLQVDCQTTRHKLKLHDFFGKPNVDIIHQGKKYTFQKAELFGFQECGGSAFRFFNGEEYRIREVQSTVIYQKQVNVPGISGKGVVSVTKLFFSTGLEAPIQPLTKTNLKRAYAERHAFHDRLDADFSDEEVSVFDTFHRMYRVNYLLKEMP